MRIATGCTFNGFIHSFPEVRIDNFTDMRSHREERLYFISHAHADHLTGFSGANFGINDVIISTEATKVLICNSHTSKNVSKIRSYAVNETHRIPVGIKNFIEFTLIPNYHCIGSVMILLESEGRSVLYTGDIRCEDAVNSALKVNFKLQNYLAPRGKGKQLDCVYMDTTFSYRSENIEIRSNMRSIHELISLITQYPEGAKFKFVDVICGFENVWYQLGLKFGFECLHFDSFLRERFKSLMKVKDIDELMIDPVCNLTKFVKYLNDGNTVNKPSKYKFYVGKYNSDETYEDFVIVKHLIDLTEAEYNCLHGIKYVQSIDEKMLIKSESRQTFEATFPFEAEGETYLITKEYFMSPDKQKLLPKNLKFVHSRHSSYIETYRFLQMFHRNVKEVYGLTDSEITWNQGFSMERYYGMLCDSMTSQFTFDEERKKMYPDVIRSKEPVKSISYWTASYEETESQTTGVEQNQPVSQVNSLVFKGQWVKDKNDILDQRRFDSQMKYFNRYRGVLVASNQGRKLRPLNRFREYHEQSLGTKGLQNDYADDESEREVDFLKITMKLQRDHIEASPSSESVRTAKNNKSESVKLEIYNDDAIQMAPKKKSNILEKETDKRREESRKRIRKSIWGL
ncbi:hypothetical protein CANARDRAFT_211672 [[Candida] arabinofermentans NRRL YB-2248]|uniref:DNA repair metallo-beta-lactamase domain-containing protein n=1 Tax=[Candida] arabinofermentans NRRL YB-2248 TaxID=983967 RepID=A0A1E4T3D7_9ASCO|nr:hypothetical protein CANARDRAFT_211672 [[Candida] arabinofermentans NRRL YB-2248]